ncbi:hypothetical protein [Adhaeribacter swui]|nr:hypothetical protein [Adhaeribacter swui]
MPTAGIEDKVIAMDKYGGVPELDCSNEVVLFLIEILAGASS